MTSLADRLPPEIARQVHPDWRRNEADFWKVRDDLLREYVGKWVAFADGAVLASGVSPVEVFHAAQATDRHPFVICVGREEQPTRMRSCTFRYDSTYSLEPLPQIDVEFRTTKGQPGVLLGNVIPDTGADASAIPWSDCQSLKLDPSLGIPGLYAGVSGATAVTLSFQLWAQLDGQEYPCRLQADFSGKERLLGRDVLNRLNILFLGPAGEVVVNP